MPLIAGVAYRIQDCCGVSGFDGKFSLREPCGNMGLQQHVWRWRCLRKFQNGMKNSCARADMVSAL